MHIIYQYRYFNIQVAKNYLLLPKGAKNIVFADGFATDAT